MSTCQNCRLLQLTVRQRLLLLIYVGLGCSSVLFVTLLSLTALPPLPTTSFSSQLFLQTKILESSSATATVDSVTTTSSVLADSEPLEVSLPFWRANSDLNVSRYVRPHRNTALLVPDVWNASTTPAAVSRKCAPFLLAVVHSSVRSSDARRAIRSTWAAKYTGRHRTHGFQADVQVVFVLGTSSDQRAMELVRLEALEHADILQEDFVDVYTNLTIKSIYSLKWAVSACRASYILKCDEDMFINMDNLLALLRQLHDPLAIVGSLTHHSPVVRDSSSHYYTPRYMYANDTYPAYVSGTAYALGADAARVVYKRALRTRLFHLEDVFVTGMCAGRGSGVRLRHDGGFRRQRLVRPPDKCVLSEIVSYHGVSPSELLRVWRELVAMGSNTTCHWNFALLNGWKSSVSIWLVLLLLLWLLLLTLLRLSGRATSTC